MVMQILNFSLPLSNPVLIFSVILFVILAAPILLNRLRIPHLIGLIIAGAIIGPHGLHLLERDSSIILFGTVGLLYIMFLAGVEIDLLGFKKNTKKGLVFGIYTFLVPMVLGTLAGLYVLNFSVASSVLLASMFASHTLVTYPIIRNFGVVKNRAVSIGIGGTVVTDTLALLVLAVIVAISVGAYSNAFWVRFGLSTLAFGAIVIFIFPWLTHRFLKKYTTSVSQYIFVLALVFLGSFLAQAAGLEAMLGAFFVGLAINRYIPNTSALMNRIEFVGNALFIPFFLIGVGMLVDITSFIRDEETIKVSIVMTVIALSAKFIAAWLAQKTFKLSVDERQILFGLSNSQAAATLAAVLIGFNIVLGYTPDGEPIRLLNESVLNGSILMILITCTISSFATQKAAYNIAMKDSADTPAEENGSQMRILLPLSNPDTVNNLVELSVALKPKHKSADFYGLHVIDSPKIDPEKEKRATALLEKAAITASSADHNLHQLLRYDQNIVNGITGIISEYKISDLVFGISSTVGITESFINNVSEGVLTKSNITALIYRPVQPFHSIKRHIVVLSDKVEREFGFLLWLIKLWNISRNTGANFEFYAPVSSLNILKEIAYRHPIQASFHKFESLENLSDLQSTIKPDDNLILVLSRKEGISFDQSMLKVPNMLNQYFQNNSFILIYPSQKPLEDDVGYNLHNPSIMEAGGPNAGFVEEIMRSISSIFRKGEV